MRARERGRGRRRGGKEGDSRFRVCFSVSLSPSPIDYIPFCFTYTQQTLDENIERREDMVKIGGATIGGFLAFFAEEA